MSEPWVILTERYGADIRNPTSAQLSEAVAGLYHETTPDREHGSAWLRYGFDEGPMFVLDVSRNRSMRLEEWADQDCEQQLAPPRTLPNVSEQLAVQALEWLAKGDIDRLRTLPWSAT